MIRLHHIGKDRRGASAVEFALAAPVFIGIIVAAFQFGLLFFANAGLSSAVAEGARLATIFPRPNDAAIIARMSAKRFGIQPARLTGPTIVHGVVDGATYADISVGYSMPLDFIFFQTAPVALTETRRVFTQPVA